MAFLIERMITSMRAIRCNGLNYFFYYCERVGLDNYIPELRFYAVDRFYHRLDVHIIDKRISYEEN
jgi:maltoporin